MLSQAIDGCSDEVLDRPIRPFDVRLKRELAHRRLFISIARRFLRVVCLHLLDGAVIAGTLLILSRNWAPFQSVSEYSFAILAIFLLSLNGLAAYDPGDARRDHRRLFSGVGLALLILTCLVVFPPRLDLPLSALLVFGSLSFMALAVGRNLVDRLVRQMYVRGFGLRRAVMVGELDEVGRALERLRDDQSIDQYVEGHLVPDHLADPTALGHIDDLPRILEERNIQEVIVAAALPAAVTRWIADCCFDHGAKLFVVPAVTEAVRCRVEPLRVGACPLLRLHPAELELPSLLLKRVFDLVIAGLMLLVALPLMALIAVAIKFDSPGPVFFKASRVGLGGQLFSMWKFRSMYVDSEAREKDLAHLNIYQGGTFKIRNDPRVTRVGRVLRRTSLDELPQIFNVLRGEMSLVGPRPALVSDLERYEPHHFERLSVIPGITGPWQVSGRNLITDFETICRIDRIYIRRWSLLLDIKIMLRTLKVVVTGEGAF